MSDGDDFQLGSAQPAPKPAPEYPATTGYPAAPKAEPQPPEPIADVFIMNAPPADPASTNDMQNVGLDLAAAMNSNDQEPLHPVVLFGTANSGKTSLLLSLFSTLTTQASLETGLFLLPPLLGDSSPVGQKLHDEARHTFELKTQHFIDGQKIGKTNVDLPFFVPVEFRPKNRPPVRFAFMESNGEWYRPDKKGETLFKPLRRGIETFISRYEGGITFLYLVPYTQAYVDEQADNLEDSRQLSEASLAIAGVLKTYNSVRVAHRDRDNHLMLVSKWDAHNRGDPEQSAADAVDRSELEAFCNRRHSQALATFRGLGLRDDQIKLDAYCAGVIGQSGLLHPRHDYAVRLWTWLYKNALRERDHSPVSPFPEKPQPPAIWRFITSALDKITG